MCELDMHQLPCLVHVQLIRAERWWRTVAYGRERKWSLLEGGPSSVLLGQRSHLPLTDTWGNLERWKREGWSHLIFPALTLWEEPLCLFYFLSDQTGEEKEVAGEECECRRESKKAREDKQAGMDGAENGRTREREGCRHNVCVSALLPF